MHPWVVALIVLAAVIILFAVFLKIPNVSKDGGTSSRFNIIRALVFAGLLLAGILYAIFKKN